MKRSRLEELSRGSRWAEEPLNPDSKSGKAFSKNLRSGALTYTPKVGKIGGTIETTERGRPATKPWNAVDAGWEITTNRVAQKFGLDPVKDRAAIQRFMSRRPNAWAKRGTTRDDILSGGRKKRTKSAYQIAKEQRASQFRNIQTGPRGGQYYVTESGAKVYV